MRFLASPLRKEYILFLQPKRFIVKGKFTSQEKHIKLELKKYPVLGLHNSNNIHLESIMISFIEWSVLLPILINGVLPNNFTYISES